MWVVWKEATCFKREVDPLPERIPEWIRCCVMSYCRRFVDLETEEILPRPVLLRRERRRWHIWSQSRRKTSTIASWTQLWRWGFSRQRENLSEIRDTCTWTSAVVWTLKKGVFWKNFQSRCRNFQWFTSDLTRKPTLRYFNAVVSAQHTY